MDEIKSEKQVIDNLYTFTDGMSLDEIIGHLIHVKEQHHTRYTEIFLDFITWDNICISGKRELTVAEYSERITWNITALQGRKERCVRRSSKHVQAIDVELERLAKIKEKLDD